MIKTTISRWAMTPYHPGPTVILKFPERSDVAYLSLREDAAKLETRLDFAQITRLIQTLNRIRDEMPLAEKD